jgi:phage tail protein X
VSNTYVTVTNQRDTWDKISFRLYTNEFFVDQLIAANPQYVYVTEFDAGVQLAVPIVLAPKTISNVVWGGVVRYS